MSIGKVTRLGLAIAAAAAHAAWAGPPYVTDDPEPTRTGGWENYAFVTGANAPGATAGQAGLQLNYGAAPDLQLSLSLPENYLLSHGLRAGPGDINASAKLRVLHPNDGWLPDIAIFPALSIPNGARAFTQGHATLFLPVWLEKDFGKWSTFGGGGYDLNPGAGQRNYTLAGWALTRNITNRLNLGAEINHQTRSTAAGSASTSLALGLIYQMTKHWALLASGGPNLERPSHSQTSTFYVSVQFTN